jgi:hypothetical protein
LRRLQSARDIAQRITGRIDEELGRDEHAARVAASAPERSRLRQAVQELLDGVLDRALAGNPLEIKEALPTFDFERVRIFAEAHRREKRGEALLPGANAGVAVGDRLAYEKAISKDPKKDGSMVGLLEEAQEAAGVVRELRQVEALRSTASAARPTPSRRWHGCYMPTVGRSRTQ